MLVAVAVEPWEVCVFVAVDATVLVAVMVDVLVSLVSGVAVAGPGCERQSR